jgi:hypothetical protein
LADLEGLEVRLEGYHHHHHLLHYHVITTTRSSAVIWIFPINITEVIIGWSTTLIRNILFVGIRSQTW